MDFMQMMIDFVKTLIDKLKSITSYIFGAFLPEAPEDFDIGFGFPFFDDLIKKY